MCQPKTVVSVVPVCMTSFALLATGCAGPATPLGAPWATESSHVRNGPLSFISSIFQKSQSTVQFDPPRQVLHGASPVKVVIRDPAGIKSNFKLVVRYNALDVTGAFARQAQVTFGKDEVSFRLPVMRLSPNKDHLIEVIYGGNNAYARLEPPSCHAFAQERVHTTGGFSPPYDLVRTIEKISSDTGFNPAFTAALIAQESGFNPRTVSWAKAIGLTQVTPIADEEIAAQYSDWPRYPGLNAMPTFWVKALISSGKVNRNNEWRLNSELSVRGGLIFAQTLSRRWSTTENLARIRETFANPEEERTKLLLASYNSGYSRVQSALIRFGANWLSAPELAGARRYVNRILSYCDYFSEVPHAEET